MPIFSSAWWRRGQDCLLCGDEACDVICAACERTLPAARPACARCALPLAIDGVCGECRKSAPEFDAAVAAFAYRFPVDRLVHRFKFSADLAAGGWLARCLAERVRGEPRPDAVVAAPLAPGRLRARGFNQALEIARIAARMRGVPLVRDGLTRRRETAPQPGLDRAGRRANLAGAFACARDFAGRHVAVVDDVMTSGATAGALARSLREAGAARISIWVVARTPDPHDRGS